MTGAEVETVAHPDRPDCLSVTLPRATAERLRADALELGGFVGEVRAVAAMLAPMGPVAGGETTHAAAVAALLERACERVMDGEMGRLEELALALSAEAKEVAG